MNKNTHSEDGELDQIFNDFRMKEINRFSISSRPINKLSACLSKLKVDALSERAMYLGIDDTTYMKKSELADVILYYYQTPGNIKELISWATENELDMLKQFILTPYITVNQDTLQHVYLQARYLFNIGLIHIFKQKDAYIFAIQDEIKEVLLHINWKKLNKISIQNHEVAQYCRAAVSLYGALSLEQLYDLYLHYKQGETMIKKTKFNITVYNSQVRSQTYWTDHVNIYSEYFDSDEMNSDLLLEILFSDKPYYRPERTEFFNYSEVTYKPMNSKLEDLMRYLSKFGSLSDELWEDLRYEILYDIEFGRLQDIVDELDRLGIIFKSRNDIDQFMKYYMQAVNHTRIWRNHGHTPVEIRELYAENVREPLNKVGRNEPCPCGSGKKYKKCCGAN